MKSTDIFGKFVDCLKKVTRQLRLLNQYAARLGNDSEVQSTIVNALIKLIYLWCKARDLFTSQKSLSGHWTRLEPSFESAEDELSNYVRDIGDIVKVEAAFGKEARSGTEPLKMLLQ